MPIDSPDAEYVAELLRRQDALQAEARQVVAELDLMPILEGAGKPERLGSSVSGLMVWRDIDVSVLGRDLTLERVWETMRPLHTHARVIRAEYRNETGQHVPAELRGDERFYFVLHYLASDGNEWKIDVSFWLSGVERDERAYLEHLRSQLTDETRIAILWIKDVWHRLPTYPYEVGGYDVYDAVLEHGVRTPDEFEVYLRRRGLPSR